MPADEVTFLRDAPARPISVWLLVGALSTFLLYLVIRAAQFAQASSSHESSLRLGLTLALYCVVGGTFALLAVCIFRGKSWSRWVGAALMVAFGAAGFARPDITVYTNDAQRAGGFIGRMVIVPSLYLWWLYAFGFSIKAKRFFSRQTAPDA